MEYENKPTQHRGPHEVSVMRRGNGKDPADLVVAENRGRSTPSPAPSCARAHGWWDGDAAGKGKAGE